MFFDLLTPSLLKLIPKCFIIQYSSLNSCILSRCFRNSGDLVSYLKRQGAAWLMQLFPLSSHPWNTKRRAIPILPDPCRRESTRRRTSVPGKGDSEVALVTPGTTLRQRSSFSFTKQEQQPRLNSTLPTLRQLSRRTQRRGKTWSK